MAEDYLANPTKVGIACAARPWACRNRDIRDLSWMNESESRLSKKEICMVRWQTRIENVTLRIAPVNLAAQDYLHPDQTVCEW